jgi:cytochrome o ubiquinol oxidase operon protein cyoD
MKPEARAEARRYTVGALLSAGLTALAFWVAAEPALPRGTMMAVTGLAALVQVAVQLRCFLHLGWRNQKREDLQLILFSALLLAIMAGGTLWIMASLAARMH